MKDEEIKKEVEYLVKYALSLRNYPNNDQTRELRHSVLNKLADLTDYADWVYHYILECEVELNPETTNPFIAEMVGYTLHDRLPEEERWKIIP